ncbi:MAG: type II secretion system protein [Patescibacteria group bacterium]
MGFRKKRGGFTLIELLVAVSIFSGIIVLTLGAFARSANSSLKSSAVRERTEAARTVVDRIGNDTQYLYVASDFNAAINQCHSSTTAVAARGLYFSDDCLFMVLKYPDVAGLVTKRYARADRAIGPIIYNTLELTEARGCAVPDPGATIDFATCNPAQTGQGVVIGDKYLLASGSEPAYSASNQLFSGITPLAAANQNPATTAILRLNVIVKGVDVANQPCVTDPNTNLTSSHCYTIKTSFVVGN